MIGLTLHPMKELRIVIAGEHVKFVTNMLDSIKVGGYTLIHNISGRGHHGFHAHLTANDMDSLVMLITIVAEEKLEPILAGLKPVFDRHTGVLWVADVAFSRSTQVAAKDQKK